MTAAIYAAGNDRSGVIFASPAGRMWKRYGTKQQFTRVEHAYAALTGNPLQPIFQILLPDDCTYGVCLDHPLRSRGWGRGGVFHAVPTEAALAAIHSRLDDITAALRLMIATQATHGEILAKIFEAACPSEEGGELEEAMRRVASALHEQTTVLERVETELSGLGAEVEAGVLRGLSQALGVDGADDDGDAVAEVGARSRAGEGSAPPKADGEPTELAGGC